MIEIDSEEKWDDFCKMQKLKLLLLTGLILISVCIDEFSAISVIKPCEVKWCGICKQLKKKLLQLYSMKDLTMASVDTELIPSLRFEFKLL